MLQPKSKHVSDVLRIKVIIRQKHTIRHTETHWSIIGPNSNSSWSSMQFSLQNCRMNIIESFFHDSKTFLFKSFKLSWSTQSITDRHSHYSSHTSWLLRSQFKFFWRKYFLRTHFLKQNWKSLSVFIFSMNQCVLVKSWFWYLFIQPFVKVQLLRAHHIWKFILIFFIELLLSSQSIFRFLIRDLLGLVLSWGRYLTLRFLLFTIH